MDFEELNRLLFREPAVLLYFYNDDCMPCKALRPKVAAC
jgi:thiol-disulfide isomerase/thioredoxin